jgi:endo-1,4-beta-D-glucanase Y
VKNGGGVYSEGIGYGMLMAVNNDDRTLFDKLWKFYMDHLDPNGLMNWSMDACAAPGNNNANAASDGDLDAAMGLVVAEGRWGGYKAQALELIGKIKKFETDVCQNGLTVLRPGDKWGGCTESATKGKVNPSYFSPGYYRAFAALDPANADFWKKLATDSYTLLAQYQTAMNGLVPEWGFSDGTAESNSYDYNACRTPWRIAMDFMWYCTPEAKTVLDKFGKYQERLRQQQRLRGRLRHGRRRHQPSQDRRLREGVAGRHRHGRHALLPGHLAPAVPAGSGRPVPGGTLGPAYNVSVTLSAAPRISICLPPRSSS